MIPIEAFCEQYQVGKSSIYMKIPKRPEWLVKKSNVWYVDVKYLNDIQVYRKKLWLISHDYYNYFLEVVGITQAQLARSLAKSCNYSPKSCNTFLDKSMWMIPDHKLVNTNISKMLDAFIKFSEYTIPKIHSKKKFGITYKKRLKEMR